MLTTQSWTQEQWQAIERAYWSKHKGFRVYWMIKRMTDVILAIIGIVLLLPLLIVIAIAVRLSSPGPILFVQERLGKLGKPFYIYKFRTMVDGAIHIGAGLDTFQGDPRVTSVGLFLREYHLDELPQLFNVVRGEMSLIGPRPLLLESLKTYSSWQKKRLLMLPGMTALEAVEGGLENDWDERIRLDVWYVDHWSIWLDLVILLRTIPVVLRKEGVYASTHLPHQDRREQP
jgi:lipopolysaccharide/colanic/teichoic acid biosynthesis glycosyltransferase